MAITSAICSSFKQELLQGKHNFAASGGDCIGCHSNPQGSRRAAAAEFPADNAHAHYGAALDEASCLVCHSVGTHMDGYVELIDPDDGSIYRFVLAEEVTNTSGTAYTAGGATLTRSGVGLTGTTAFTDFGDVTYTSASFTANGAMIYNTTTGTGTSTTDSVAIIAFGGDKTASNGTFKIEFPANDATAAIIRLA